MLLYIFLTLIIYPQGFRNQQSSISELLTKPPFLMSILFVANPVLTEAVNAVSFREDLLTFLFYTATLNLYLLLRSNFTTSRRSFLLYAVSCFLYFAALLSKEMAATLPLIILCYELIYGADEKKGFRAILFNPYNIGYVTIILVYLYLRFYSFHNVAEQEIPSWDITYRIYSLPWLFLNYLKLTAFPVSLSIDHYFSPLEHLSVISAILYLIVAIAILALTIVVGRKDRFVAFGMSFFIITLIPVYNIIPIANPFAERYLYLPAIGFLIVAGSVFIRLYEIKNGSHGTSITVVFFIILIINSLSVIERNRVWQDTYSLWTDAVKKSPNNYHAIDNLGLYYYKIGRLNEAIAQFQTATKLNPDYADARRNLGNAYYDSGYFDEAVQQFQIAIRLNPYEPRHYANLAVAYSKIGRLDEAATHYQAALKLKPDMPSFYFDLGNVYADSGKLDDAIRMYKEGLKLKNDDPIKYYNLGLMYRAQGRIYEAASEFNNTLQINPDYLPARQALQSISEK